MRLNINLEKAFTILKLKEAKEYLRQYYQIEEGAVCFQDNDIIAGIQYILGLNIYHNTMSFNPCIPKEWTEFEIKYKFGESIYNIKVYNSNQNTSGVKQVSLNGNIIEDKHIKLQNDGGINEVVVLM